MNYNSCNYTPVSPPEYSPDDELHLNRDSPEAKILIAQGSAAYKAFADRYRSILSLKQVKTIEETYNAAQAEGIFKLAAQLRKAFFSKDIHFYGVSYLWDMCMESCIYCPAALQNRIKTKYKPLALTIDEAIKDVHYIMRDGHRHLCVLTGEDPVRHPPKILAEYIRAFDQLGLKEIILNVEPPANWQDFTLWREAARHTALQFRVFQETYNRERYAKIHPLTKRGRKHDFDFRYLSQERALACGFDNVGLGVLFGIHHFPIEEIDSLQQHALELQEKTGKWPARICLPSAKYLETIGVDIPFSLPITAPASTNAHTIYWKFSELVYALTRLALPSINIVSSERDEPDLLAMLDQYATCTTLNVHPGVGDNIRFHEKTVCSQIHFEQSPTFSRQPYAVITDLRTRGYRPLLAELKED